MKITEVIFIALKETSLSFPGILIGTIGVVLFIGGDEGLEIYCAFIMILMGLSYIFAMVDFIKRIKNIESIIADAIRNSEKEKKQNGKRKT